MDYAEIKQAVNMERLLGEYGVTLDRHRRTPCPIHNGDNKSGFSVSSDLQAWKCFTGDCGGGDIFTFVEKREGCSNAEARRKIEQMFSLADEPQPERPIRGRETGKKPIKDRIEYQYRDKAGKPLFSTLRIEFEDGTKTFRQRCGDKWTLPDEIRTLYNLDRIHGATDEPIFVCEGEKAAEAISSCGYIGTTNPMGSGNWEPRYAQILKGKMVVVMPDADEQGEKWRNEVCKSLVGVCGSLQVFKVPDSFIDENPQFKGHDVADMLEVMGKYDLYEWIQDQLAIVEALPNGVSVDLLGRPSDIFERIRRRIENGIDPTVFSFAEWIPSLDVKIRKGDLVVIMANTGVGKSRILHNIPYHIRRLNYAIFDLELSQETLAMRYAAMENRVSFEMVEQMLQDKIRRVKPVDVDNVFVQKIPNLTVEKIAERVELLEKATGKDIHCVGIDYIGLMGGMGSAYERTSNNVEAFKQYCSQSGKVGLMTTQVSRPEEKGDGLYRCPSIFQAKNSGSMENSAQVLFGVWKDKTDAKALHMKLMKYTHGACGGEEVDLYADNLLIRDMKGNRN